MNGIEFLRSLFHSRLCNQIPMVSRLVCLQKLGVSRDTCQSRQPAVSDEHRFAEDLRRLKLRSWSGWWELPLSGKKRMMKERK